MNNKPIEAMVCACGHTKHAITEEERAAAWLEFDKAAATHKVREINEALRALEKCHSLKTPRQARLENLTQEMYRKHSWMTDLVRSFESYNRDYDKFEREFNTAVADYKVIAKEWHELNTAENESVWDKMMKGEDDDE